MTRVLVYCPLNPEHPRVYPATLQSILALSWPGPLEVVLGRQDGQMPDTAGKYASLVAKLNHARTLALAGGYDHMLTVEADMIVPQIALERMTRVEADVVYGLYCSRRPGRKQGPSRWLMFSEVTDKPYSVKRLADTDDDRRALWGQVVESQGMGLGCTLISRRVLEAIPFRCPDPEVSSDWYLSLDLQAGGFSQAHDLGVVCGHIDGDTVLWPDPDKGYWIEG